MYAGKERTSQSPAAPALFDGEGCFGEEETLPALCLDAAGSFDEGLRACAGRIAGAMGARPVTVPAFHWCSWYYLYHNLDETILEEYRADLLVNALGRRADDSQYLEGVKERVAKEIYNIGDSFQAGLILGATRAAYNLALYI